MNILESDCRLDGVGYRRFNKATHLPTGSVVEFGKLVGKREILKALDRYVAERSSADLLQERK